MEIISYTDTFGNKMTFYVNIFEENVNVENASYFNEAGYHVTSSFGDLDNMLNDIENAPNWTIV